MKLTTMNTQLKKRDKCQSPWGVVTVNKVIDGSDIVTVDHSHGIFRMIHREELTRIPSFEEEMQAVIDIAMDVENRLEDSETVQLRVGQFVKFVRHYCAIKDALEEYINNDRHLAGQIVEVAQLSEKLLKGETTI